MKNQTFILPVSLLSPCRQLLEWHYSDLPFWEIHFQCCREFQLKFYFSSSEQKDTVHDLMCDLFGIDYNHFSSLPSKLFS